MKRRTRTLVIAAVALAAMALLVHSVQAGVYVRIGSSRRTVARPVVVQSVIVPTHRVIVGSPRAVLVRSCLPRRSVSLRSLRLRYGGSLAWSSTRVWQRDRSLTYGSSCRTYGRSRYGRRWRHGR